MLDPASVDDLAEAIRSLSDVNRRNAYADNALASASGRMIDNRAEDILRFIQSRMEDGNQSVS